MQKYISIIMVILAIFFGSAQMAVSKTTHHGFRHHSRIFYHSSTERRKNEIRVAHRVAFKKFSFFTRITAYWARGRGTDKGTRRHNGAWVGNGRLHEGHCAVDPRKIPYGSKIIYPDKTIDIAGDTGTDVKSRKAARRSGHNIQEKSALVIDKFFETEERAMKWVNSHPLFAKVDVLIPVTLP